MFNPTQIKNLNGNKVIYIGKTTQHIPNITIRNNEGKIKYYFVKLEDFERGLKNYGAIVAHKSFYGGWEVDEDYRGWFQKISTETLELFKKSISIKEKYFK